MREVTLYNETQLFCVGEEVFCVFCAVEKLTYSVRSTKCFKEVMIVEQCCGEVLCCGVVWCKVLDQSYCEVGRNTVEKC